MAKLIRPIYLLPICLVLAWLFDHFFWGKEVGISFSIFTLLLVAAGIWLARRSGIKPARESWWLVALILLLSLVSMLRSEPFTLLTSRLLTVILLGFLALSLEGGRWVSYGFADYFANLLALIPRGLGLLRSTGEKRALKKGKPSLLRSIAPVLRGLLFVLPLLLFLAVLLSSADAYFGEWLGELFFDIEEAPEYLLRGLIIMGLAYALAAAYQYAVARSKDQKLLADGKPLVAPLLGFGEAATMLASVSLLFAAFVIVQFRYFFGGAANIVLGPSGLTYAEYARRGFFELVVVAVTSLIFFVALSGLARRQIGRQQAWFSGLGIGLFVLVAVILVSAFQRLLLLEEAYGFSRLRTYPHVFMAWLGILLLVIAVLETLGRQRAFALAVMLAVVGFTLTLPILNVDAFIARVNLDRQEASGELDYLYLASLSEDAVPEMVAAYKTAVESGDQELSSQLAAALVCQVASLQEPAQPWQSWTWSSNQAQMLLTQINFIAELPVGEEIYCRSLYGEPDFP